MTSNHWKLSDKFKDVPEDDETYTEFRREFKFGEYDVLYEKWSWEGITAETLVFVSEEIASMQIHALEDFVRESSLVKEWTNMTIKENDNGFTFVNFNFEY